MVRFLARRTFWYGFCRTGTVVKRTFAREFRAVVKRTFAREFLHVVKTDVNSARAGSTKSREARSARLSSTKSGLCTTEPRRLSLRGFCTSGASKSIVAGGGVMYSRIEKVATVCVSLLPNIGKVRPQFSCADHFHEFSVLRT